MLEESPRRRRISSAPPLPHPGRFFDPPRPRIFAHRGLAIDAPENTPLAFLKALAAGATHLETDVHASRDGVAVISHDPDLSRLVGHDARVEDLSMAELRCIDLGYGQSFCSLEEALHAFPEALFNIDVKTERAERPTAVAIAAAAATDRVLITSFSESRRRRTADALGAVASSASVARFLPAVLAAKVGLSPVVRRALRGLDAVQVPERRGAFRIVSPRTVRAMHAAGVEVHVWTVNDPADMNRLLDWGADGLVTDRCDLAVGLLRSRS